MKGLLYLPSPELLNRAYAALQGDISAEGPRESELAVYSQWARLEPRLAELWVDFVGKHWAKVHPVTLNRALRLQPWPASAGVLLDQAREWKPLKPLQLFLRWSACVLEGIEPMEATQQYFIGNRKLGGLEMKRDVTLTHRSFLNWGFFGRERLQNKAASGGRTLIPFEQRRGVLDEFIQRLPRITTRDYIDALEGCVSRRQAELDLCSHPRLSPVGKTKARYYRIAKSSR